jgi:hypothetical protein
MPTPSLYIREKTREGTWRYRRIKEGRGVKTGDLSAPFFARPFVNGRQMWKTLVAQSFKEAKEEASHLGIALDARSKGLTVSEAESLSNASRIPIKSAVDTYLEQKSGKVLPST